MAQARSRFQCGIMIALTLALSGCLSGDDRASTNQVTSPPSNDSQVVKPRVPNGKHDDGENAVPVVSGTPPTEISVGQEYEFLPQASDADGDVLTFMIQNKPDWASFDDTTGRLTGSPTSADVGAYADVIISVTDGVSSSVLAPFTITVAAIATGQATISWTAPTQNVDGTPLTNLAGYKIYYGQDSTRLSKVIKVGVGTSRAVIENLAVGKWYFAMSSYNSSGVESARTAAVSKTIDSG